MTFLGMLHDMAWQTGRHNTCIGWQSSWDS